MSTEYLKGVATLIKTPEGDIKLPRTAAVLVQTASGSNVETELANRITISEYQSEIEDIMGIIQEFQDLINDFKYDIGTSANYVELANLNREVTGKLDEFYDAIIKMDAFIVWDEKWEAIEIELKNAISELQDKVTKLENDTKIMETRLRNLEDKEEPTITDINLSSMLASTEVFEMLVNNNLEIDETKLESLTDIYTELVRREIKGINEVPEIIRKRIIRELLL